MSDTWLNRETRLRRTSPDGGLYIVNALAFSTLLSSQETDAHLRRNPSSLPGQPLNLTLEFLSCQLRFRKLPGGCEANTAVPLDTRSHPPSAWWPPCLASTGGAHETFGSRFPGGSQVLVPPSGVPSPAGQDELYGWREPPSNREFYPAGAPVLTCPDQICCRCDVRAPWFLRDGGYREGAAEPWSPAAVARTSLRGRRG